MVIACVLAGVLFCLIRYRRRRKLMLSGLVGERPQFMVGPPTRRMNDLGREAL